MSLAPITKALFKGTVNTALRCNFGLVLSCRRSYSLGACVSLHYQARTQEAQTPLRIRLHTIITARPLLSSSAPTRHPRTVGHISGRTQRFYASIAMEQNGDSRSKRKQPPAISSDRPLKQRKPEQELTSAEVGDLSPRLEARNGYDRSDEEEEAAALGRSLAVAETKEWQETIEKVVKSAVSIHFSQTCSFDTDSAMSSEATGFVVDAEKGYILTNRHVVCAGPFWGYCIFDNHEEVSAVLGRSDVRKS